MTALLLDVAWKSLITLGVTLALLRIFRERSAAQRAWIAHAGLIATLSLPLAITLLPRWEVAAAAPVADMAQPVAAFFEAPAVSADTPAMAEAAGPAVIAAAPAATPSRLAALAEPARLAALLYGLPALLLLLAMLVAIGRLFALRARALVMIEQSWLTALAHAQRRMNFKHGTALLVSDEIRSPVSWGVLRPVILLNGEALAKSSDAEAIIAHELAHVARLDWASLLLARIATALFWFNPLVWLVARQAHQLREEAADDAVLRSNVNHFDYAALLVGAARHEAHGFLLAANGVAPSRSSLKQRIARVLDQTQLRAPAYLSWIGACAIGAASVAVPLAAFSATRAPDAPLVAVAPVAPVEVTAPVRLAQAARPAAPAAVSPAPAAPEAAEPASTAEDWNGIRERAAEMAEREREKAQELVERERERAERMVQREKREAVRATRDASRAETVTIDVPGAFIQATPQGAIVRAPGVDIRADDNGAIVRAPGVNIRAGTPPNLAPPPGAMIMKNTMTMAQNAAQPVPPAPATAPRAAGEKPSADELIQMAVLGIDADYRRDIAEAGYPGLSTNELQQFKIHGVKGSWLRDLAALGYAHLTVTQVTNMAIHGVSTDFVRRANDASSTRATPEQLVQMRILGVRPGGKDKDKNKSLFGK
jgi:beta-lactamase regulating signal transducer with metallopeptidase domain